MPKARQARLVVEELADETLVYDENSHQAHCLNESAALVWKHCDGTMSVSEMARLLEEKAKAPASNDVVWFALQQLKKFRLLEAPDVGVARTEQLTRRELIRRLGIAAAVTLPLVTSIVAPEAAKAASCIAEGDPCSATPCCAGLACNGEVCAPIGL
jgi:hypothetical protein